MVYEMEKIQVESKSKRQRRGRRNTSNEKHTHTQPLGVQGQLAVYYQNQITEWVKLAPPSATLVILHTYNPINPGQNFTTRCFSPVNTPHTVMQLTEKWHHVGTSGILSHNQWQMYTSRPPPLEMDVTVLGVNQITISKTASTLNSTSRTHWGDRKKGVWRKEWKLCLSAFLADLTGCFSQKQSTFLWRKMCWQLGFSQSEFWIFIKISNHSIRKSSLSLDTHFPVHRQNK